MHGALSSARRSKRARSPHRVGSNSPDPTDRLNLRDFFLRRSPPPGKTGRRRVDCRHAVAPPPPGPSHARMGRERSGIARCRPTGRKPPLSKRGQATARRQSAVCLTYVKPRPATRDEPGAIGNRPTRPGATSPQRTRKTWSFARRTARSASHAADRGGGSQADRLVSTNPGDPRTFRSARQTAWPRGRGMECRPDFRSVQYFVNAFAPAFRACDSPRLLRIDSLHRRSPAAAPTAPFAAGPTTRPGMLS